MTHSKKYLMVRTAVRSIVYTAMIGIPTTGIIFLDALWQV